MKRRCTCFGISRKLFTHSLPLVVAEQCYEKLLSDTRDLIIESKADKKTRAYELLINIIEEYNIKLLSTKIYWENPKEREEYKNFWNKYTEINKETKDGQVQKEILFVKGELNNIENNDKNKQIIKFYKDKLLEYGVLRRFKNICKTRKKLYQKGSKGMRKLAEIEYVGVEEKSEYEKVINEVYEACFKEEDLYNYSIYISIILSDETYIKEANKKYRNIDKVTDVLSFPMFEKEEIETAKTKEEVLGDIIICIPRVKEQAKEYGHSEIREFAYMLVHGFYHLMGYDHMEEEEKREMREKEEAILTKIGINRGEM